MVYEQYFQSFLILRETTLKRLPLWRTPPSIGQFPMKGLIWAKSLMSKPLYSGHFLVSLKYM